MSRIIYHDKRFDDSIKFLEKLYEKNDRFIPTFGREQTNGWVRRSLKLHDEIWMLGHGGPDGLYSRPNCGEWFDRHLISSRHVNFLRGDKKLFGMWCYANSFAEKYDLKGLFSGMIISERTEAEWVLGIRPSQKVIDACNEKIVDVLSSLLSEYDFSEIPKLLAGYERGDEPKYESMINNFNFNSWHYYK